MYHVKISTGLGAVLGERGSVQNPTVRQKSVCALPFEQTVKSVASQPALVRSSRQLEGENGSLSDK